MHNNNRIKWYKTLDSTNNEALREIDNFDNMTVIATEFQSSGRGQRGNIWLSSKAENLTISLILNFKKKKGKLIAANKQLSLNILTSLAIADFLKSKNIIVKIKWPNDIYYQNSKICGILIENSLIGDFLSHSIIGIGLNINQIIFDKSIPNPSSLKLITNKTYDLKQTLEELYIYLEKRLSSFDTEDFSLIKDEFCQLLYRKGIVAKYRIYNNSEEFKGKILGIADDFRLIIEKENGKINLFSFKEIEYII